MGGKIQQSLTGIMRNVVIVEVSLVIKIMFSTTAFQPFGLIKPEDLRCSFAV